MPKKIKIVVAGDRPMFRDGLCRQLTLEEDFEVVAQARDSYQVLDTVQKHEPDILLVDLSIPHLDGVAIFQHLQTARSKTRVIVLTGSDGKSQLVLAMKSGTSGIVSKQMAGELLIEGVRKVHAGKIWRDSLQQPPPSAPHNRKQPPLGQREREIAALVARGFTDKEVAERLFISVRTIKNQLRNIFDKLGLSNREELAHLGDDDLAGGLCVIAGDGQPRLPRRPPLSASAEAPADPYGNWVTEIPSDPKKSDSRRK